VITVIDIDLGNISSVGNALRHLGIPYAVSGDPDAVVSADQLILPGVGNFSEAMKRLEGIGMADVIRRRVLQDGVPILGICLGMQLLAARGEEGGHSRGLGLIEGTVSLLPLEDSALPLPHVGWNEVHYDDNFTLFDSIPDGACFYFVHSYAMVPAEPVEKAYSDYGVQFVAAVRKNGIVGVQFHPEKSQIVGLALLRNFFKDHCHA